MSDLTAAVAKCLDSEHRQTAGPSRFADADLRVVKGSKEADWQPEEHPRDKDGQFTDTGGSATWAPEEWQGKPYSTAKLADQKRQKEAGMKFAADHFGDSEPLTGSEAKHVRIYQDYGYGRVNGQLRKGDQFDPSVSADPKSASKNPAKVGAVVTSLDSAIAKSTVSRDVVVYHQFGGTPRTKLVGLTPGDVVSDHGYVSTSFHKGLVAERFGGDSAEIRIPAGSKALSLDQADIHGRGGLYGGADWKNSEGEVLLPRDAKFRVVRAEDNVDQGPQHDEDLRAGFGKMHLVLEYLGADPVPRAARAPREKVKVAASEAGRYEGFVTALLEANPYHDARGRFTFKGGHAGGAIVERLRGGGFTFDTKTGKFAGHKTGYYVGYTQGGHEPHKAEALKAEDVAKFVAKHAELAQPGVFLGGWRDGENVFLDVSRHEEDLQKALEFARNTRPAPQIAIYDIANKRNITVADQRRTA